MIIHLRRLRRKAIISAVLLILAIFMFNSQMVQRVFHPILYLDYITKYSRLHGVDPFLVSAIIRIESNYRPEAKSRKGATGLMQIMPDTGKWVADSLGISPYNPNMLQDPELNIIMGTWYLGSLLTEYDGNLAVALAAYNGGRGNVSSWLRDKVWSGRLSDAKDIPFPETRGYVVKVTDMYDRYRRIYGSRWPGDRR